MIDWNAIATKIIGTILVAVIFAAWKVWDRLAAQDARMSALEVEYTRNKLARDLEAKHESEARIERNADTRDISRAMEDFTKLMAKVETLLETGLKRLDILEKHVFKL